MTDPAPLLPDLCWPIDLACCSNWDEYAPEVQNRATSLATSVLRALTGYRVGGCPVTVRPCRENCAQPFLLTGYTGEPGLGGGLGLQPVNVAGTWINMGCGCVAKDCSCTQVCEVLLPPPVGAVSSVQIGVTVLPETWYRVDDGNKLVWQGPPDVTECWPLCQDMSAPVGESGTFAVTYLHGLPVDGLGAYAAGVMACEFAKACSGQKCRLPSGVTSIVRQGISMTVGGSGFTEGRTGIIEVDAWLRTVNPNMLVQSSRVWSPDLVQPRVMTWSP